MATTKLNVMPPVKRGKGRGGARPNSGPKPTGNAMTAYIVVRCHPVQRDYFNEHIGADWLRKTVDKKRGAS